MENVVKKVEEAKAMGKTVVFTLDTHEENYMETQEGRNLRAHCIRDTEGWELVPELRKLAAGCRLVEKPTFGSTVLAHLAGKDGYDEIDWWDCVQISVLSPMPDLEGSTSRGCDLCGCILLCGSHKRKP